MTRAIAARRAAEGGRKPAIAAGQVLDLAADTAQIAAGQVLDLAGACIETNALGQVLRSLGADLVVAGELVAGDQGLGEFVGRCSRSFERC